MVTIAGMITSVTRKTTKRGDIWAVLTVEDLEASIEVLLFPKAYDLVVDRAGHRHRGEGQGPGQGRRRRGLAERLRS